MAEQTEWVLKARKLAERLPAERLHPKVLGFLKDLKEGEAVGITCSGGADSVCVLLLLWTHFPELKKKLRILHFNHDLRGADSEGDEVFVKKMAEELGCGFISDKWEMKPSDSPSEAEARIARFVFFIKS
ncbi:MAG: hypothetical protein JKY51_03935 [Opitutaceae bacterium]|nr:hypothetical protein [Opitutaceae bacterium]